MHARVLCTHVYLCVAHACGQKVFSMRIACVCVYCLCLDIMYLCGCGSIHAGV